MDSFRKRIAARKSEISVCQKPVKPELGDGDPMDICVFSEKSFTHGDILFQAVPIGGLRMIDKNQADDKIIAVLEGDSVYGEWREIKDCPASLIDRLKHYFLTYKLQPGDPQNVVEIADIYDRGEAHEMILCSLNDYRLRFVANQFCWLSRIGYSV